MCTGSAWFQLFPSDLCTCTWRYIAGNNRMGAEGGVRRTECTLGSPSFLSFTASDPDTSSGTFLFPSLLSLAWEGKQQGLGLAQRLFNTSSLFLPWYEVSLLLKWLELIPCADLSEGSRECYSISSYFFSLVLSSTGFKAKWKRKPLKQGERNISLLLVGKCPLSSGN